MEEKKILEEENIEKATGGRHYAFDKKKWPWLDANRVEEMQKSALRLDLVPPEKLPPKLLDDVSGGGNLVYHRSRCPFCGANTFYSSDSTGAWIVHCKGCARVIEASRP